MLCCYLLSITDNINHTFIEFSFFSVLSFSSECSLLLLGCGFFLGGAVAVFFISVFLFHVKGIQQMTNILGSLFLFNYEALKSDRKLYVWQGFMEL